MTEPTENERKRAREWVDAEHRPTGYAYTDAGNAYACGLAANRVLADVQRTQVDYLVGLMDRCATAIAYAEYMAAGGANKDRLRACLDELKRAGATASPVTVEPGEAP